MPRPPQAWTRDELARDAATSRRLFVDERLAALERERDTYAEAVATYSKHVRALLDATVGLRHLDGQALRDRARIGIAQYLAIPPISDDDLDTLTDSCFGRWKKQKTDRGIRPTEPAFDAAASIVSERLDYRRTPWVDEEREPTPPEREAFVHWAASIPAMGKLATARRMESASRQEEAARQAARSAGYKPVSPPGLLTDPIGEMEPASYAIASRKLSGTNMDIPIRLTGDHPTGLTFLALEAKVSNSSLNSVKRLRDVKVKRETWDASGQLYRFRTGAVLAGVFDVDRVIEAQDAGVLIFWEHRLQDLTDFLGGS